MNTRHKKTTSYFGGFRNFLFISEGLFSLVTVLFWSYPKLELYPAGELSVKDKGATRVCDAVVKFIYKLTSYDKALQDRHKRPKAPIRA